jgi:hypothetical protein
MNGIPRTPPAPLRRRALGVALAALLLAGAGDATADERADRAAAQKLMVEGNRAMTDADYPLALSRFQAAYARFPSPKLLLNIGTTLRALGRNAEAAASYQAYLSDPRADRSRVTDVARSLAEIDALVGRLRIQVQGAATVRLDGKVLDRFVSGASLRVDPGEHTIVAVREGAPAALATLRIASGEERTVELALIPTPGPETIIVDRVASPQRTVGVALMSVGATGLLAAIAAGSVALVDKNHVRGHCFPGTNTCDQAGLDLAHAARTWATGSTGALIAGAGVLGAGLAVFFTAPSPGPSAAGAVGTWRFGLRASSNGPEATVAGAW